MNITKDQETGIDTSRRNFLGRGSVALATVALAAVAQGQERAQVHKAEGDHSASNPGQENKTLLEQNPNSNTPPDTDHGDVGPIWYSFDLAHKRVQEGGWTHQVTARELPSSKDIAGVNMRLTAGSFRELHWHTADEWAYMLTGKARVTVLNPDGTIFIDDVEEGDLWFFPAGFPHSIQGLGPDGCEFLLVFDEGMFSEDGTFLLSEWIAHTPDEVLAKNLGLDPSELAKLPKDELYIFPSELPGSLAADRAEVGGARVQAPQQYTFKLKAMAPTKKTAGGEVRVVDSHNFAVSKSIAAGLVTVKPGGLREMHWHPNASEWQFYIAGKARMTVFMPTSRARTMDFNANDVGYVPPVAGHYIENTGDTDLVFLEIFKADEFQDVSLNNWIRRLPTQMVREHLNLDAASIRKIPAEKQEVIGR
ncbi:cupin domain-containing protein [Granulicella tundricola]|uniref:Bicupin, oxalate decarboxylase family n=1 Tax=Granulicella tundricola (strain ATCC BAA-1859 / DSM 23138 / MP5ACTX9) TaxID=1198114 RepID=E8X6R0_GRATM|nr:cupin domain-containing protein [Granulicella tundricola]ADW71210.1 bicupin, oxalate decarboxylase family [Granulicella tundricola MP5ACTX9]